MHKPQMTVALSVYDGVDLEELKPCVTSVLAQEGVSFEFCIVLDGITRADLREYLEAQAAADARIRLIDFEQNRKLPAAMNAIIKSLDSDIMVRMDADDISLPGRFEALHAYLEAHPDIDAIGSGIIEFDGDDPFDGITRRYPLTHDAIVEQFNYNNPFAHPSMAFRRRFFNLGLYPYWTLNEDTMLFLNALAGGARFANVPDPLYAHRHDAHVRRRRQSLKRAAVVYMDRTRVIAQCGGGLKARVYAVGVFCMQVLGFGLYPRIRSMILKRSAG